MGIGRTGDRQGRKGKKDDAGRPRRRLPCPSFLVAHPCRVGQAALAVAATALLASAAGAVSADRAAPGLSGRQAEGREAWWHPGWECRLWFAVAATGTGLPGPDVGVAEFLAGGRLKPDAGDLRVVAGGGPVPHRVLVRRPSDDFVRVAFELKSGERRYAVYAGNPGARAPEKAARVGRGCLLETFELAGGDPSDLRGMREVLRRADPRPMGADFVPNVFFGHNPFGPSENFVSRYTGWLVCPEQGTYTFVTSSDDASFLLVDGDLVVQWPGWHGAVADARFRGAKSLASGLHKLEYLHVQGGGGTVAVAAWQPPSAGRVEPIPASAFSPVVRGGFVGIERLGERLCPHFEAEVVGECFFAERYSCRVLCRDRTGEAGPGRRVEWDFGDGLSAAGETVEHVYFRPGVYPITATVRLRGETASVTNRVRVERRWEAQTDPRVDAVRLHARIAADYDFGRLAGDALAPAAEFFKEAGDSATEERVLRAVVSRPAEVPGDVYLDAAVFLVRRWREDPAARVEALRLLDQAEAHFAENANARARVLRERGDVFLYYGIDLDRALGEYDKVVGRFAEKIEDNIVRLTKIRIGDVHRKRGDYDKAAAAYRDAERFRLHGVQGDPAVRRGVLMQTAETELARGDAEAALKALDVLEWECPLEKLGGKTSLVRAQAALAAKDYAEALVQLDDIVRVSPRSNWAAEALFVSAETERRLGHTAEAVRRYERLLSEYQDSVRATDAGARLEALGHGGKGAGDEPSGR